MKRERREEVVKTKTQSYERRYSLCRDLMEQDHRASARDQAVAGEYVQTGHTAQDMAVVPGAGGTGPGRGMLMQNPAEPNRITPGTRRCSY